MLRNIMMTGTALCLSMGSSLAKADHDRELRYVVGGALLGAALGELVYASDRAPVRGHVTVGYGYHPRVAYAPPRYYPRGYDARRWGHWDRPRHWHAQGRGHRHGRHCR